MFELTSTSPHPLCITNEQNGNRIIRNDGTKSPLTNSSVFSFRHLFVVAKYNGANFSGYPGLVTDLNSGWGGLIGNSGTNKFYSLPAMNNYTTWKARVNGLQVNADLIPGPMNAFKLIHISASSPVPMSGLSVGQDRQDATRRWNGDIAEIIFYEKPLLESDVWEIEEYLMTKWQIQ